MDTIISFFKENSYLITILLGIAVVFATFIIYKLIPKIVSLIRKHLTHKTKTGLDDSLLKLVESRLGKIIWIAGFFFLLRVLEPVVSESVLQYGNHILYILTVFIIASLISNVLSLLLDWYTEHWSDKVDYSLHNEFGPLFRRLIFIVVYTIAVIMILHHFQQNVSSIIVSLGVGSLAVALAAKDTLANMIAGFMIMIDRPFRMGDRILLEAGEFGDVHDIGLRSTKILTFDNTLIVVPNQKIINEKLTNYSYPNPRLRVAINVGVAYGTDLKQVKKLLIDICNNHPDVLDEPSPKAYFINFGDSSLDFKLVCYVPTWQQQWTVAEDIRLEIDRVFKEKGIEIPFPQMVVTLPGKGEK